MSETLLSVGLDVGTTTTQLIVSRLEVENRASAFAVPDMEITQRKLLYKSPVHFTPLLDAAHVDGEAIRALVMAEYARAGIRPEQVNTGAVIITGETSRKENAAAVLQALAELAGDFVVATAGPDLESLLAAQGAGAVEYSRQTGKTVLHMDIGGGTSNLALIEDGVVIRTGCLNVGGRLVKFDSSGAVTYVSPVLRDLCSLQVGTVPGQAALEQVAGLMNQALEMAAGVRPPGALLEALTTEEATQPWICPSEPVCVSFSGGVAECIRTDCQALAFGDMGPMLGIAIREGRLCRGEYILGQETIRATVIGAGCHSTQLSGSTVFCRDVALPVKNLPVAVFTSADQESPAFSEQIRRELQKHDTQRLVLAMPGVPSPSYGRLCQMADAIAEGIRGGDCFVCLESDMAKALGHLLCLRLPPKTPIVCIDRLRLRQGSFLDIGAPVGPAMPVVIKTLVLSQRRQTKLEKGKNGYGTG